ncbi:MAG: SMI1/KNR4 family protein [Polyangiaceae bacterium]|nr:SMI1/KNR4 family protein [Polyangiaceae bacterium]
MRSPFAPPYGADRFSSVSRGCLANAPSRPSQRADTLGASTMSLPDRVASTASRLHRAASRRLTPLGAEHHRFRVQHPVPESELQAFETRHRVLLPDAYRAFVGTVSRGGAGPAYGLIPFGDDLLPDGAPPGFLAAPFVYDDALGGDDALTDADEELARPGTLSLCDEGSGYTHFLVCTGALRGQMCIDATVSDGGFVPLKVGFLEWFDRWLNAVLDGQSGTWWLKRRDDAAFAAEVKAMKPWWRRL